MVWIVLHSFWRNRRRYSLFSLSLALSILVASLGMSGVQFASTLWRQPLLASMGGHIVLRAKAPWQSSMGFNQPFAVNGLLEAIRQVFPEAAFTSTLTAPVRPVSESLRMPRLSEITGRSGGLDVWYLNPIPRAGEMLSAANAAQDVFVISSWLMDESTATRREQVTMPRYDQAANVMRLDSTPPVSIEIIGTVQEPAVGGGTHLDTLQKLTGTPDGLVSGVGVGLLGVQAEIDPVRLAKLRSLLEADYPSLEITTIDDMTAEFGKELEPLRQSTTSVLPFILGIALLVLLATALAVVQARRRELALLRVIGMSARQVWLMFTVELMIAAGLAGGVGLVLSKLVGYVLFGGRMASGIADFLTGLLATGVSPLPIVLSLLGTLLVTALVSAWAVSRAMTSVLRNA